MNNKTISREEAKTVNPLIGDNAKDTASNVAKVISLLQDAALPIDSSIGTENMFWTLYPARFALHFEENEGVTHCPPKTMKSIRKKAWSNDKDPLILLLRAFENIPDEYQLQAVDFLCKLAEKPISPLELAKFKNGLNH